jgi:chromosomal replication initiation ATPase DnaA
MVFGVSQFQSRALAQRTRGESGANYIAAVVASAFAISVAAIRKPDRGRARVAFARQVAMYLAHTRLGLDFTAAGAAFDRDRTTAAHAVRIVEERRESPAVDSSVDYLERAIDIWLEKVGTR